MRDGPRGFGRDSSCPGLLRCRSCGTLLRIRGSHPLRRAVPCASPRIAPALERSYNPAAASPRWRFGLFPVRSPLLGESLLLSLPAGTKMFQFPAFASVFTRMTESLPPGCPIRTSAGRRVFAPRRGFSQLVASFVASESQGILHAPFLVVLCFLKLNPWKSFGIILLYILRADAPGCIPTFAWLSISGLLACFARLDNG